VGHSYWSADWAIVWATLLLGAITLGLALYTALLYRTTKVSSKAAQEGAEALPKLERAYLFEEVEMDTGTGVVEMQLRIAEEPDELIDTGFGRGLRVKQPVSPLQYSFKLVNYGKTPAVIKSITCGADHFNADFLDRPSAWQAERIETEKVLPPGKAYTGQIIDNIPLDKAALGENKKGRMFFKVYGKVVYEDVFGKTHETSWYWAYNGVADTFHPFRSAGQDYNYQT
jgi:hypothetical protein